MMRQLSRLFSRSRPSSDSTGCATPKDWNKGQKLPIMGSEEIMSAKAHGTSANPVMSNLRFGVDPKLTDRICNFNRVSN